MQRNNERYCMKCGTCRGVILYVFETLTAGQTEIHTDVICHGVIPLYYTGLARHGSRWRGSQARLGFKGVS